METALLLFPREYQILTDKANKGSTDYMFRDLRVMEEIAQIFYFIWGNELTLTFVEIVLCENTQSIAFTETEHH